MTNEELALQIRAGERGRITELWARVRRFALWRARRWAAFGRGVTVDDLEQEAFIALLDALERWREADGPLLSVYALRLKAAFTAATGRRTQRDRLDPLDRALSLDAPLWFSCCFLLDFHPEDGYNRFSQPPEGRKAPGCLVCILRAVRSPN